MFEYKLTEADAKIELNRLLKEDDFNTNFEKLADIALCYFILGEIDLAEEYDWKSYDLFLNKYAAINLSRIYINLEKVNELEVAYIRFANDKIPMHPSDGLKLFAKHYRTDVLKKLLSYNWGSLKSYLKYLYKCGEYEFCVNIIEERFSFDKYYIITDKNADVFYYWMLSKIQLNQFFDIENMFSSMKLSAKKSVVNKICLAALSTENCDIFLNVIEDLYAETNYNDANIRSCLMQIYNRQGYNVEKTQLAKLSIKGQIKLIDKNITRIISALYFLQSFEDIENIKNSYKEFQNTLNMIVDNNCSEYKLDD